MLKIHGKPACLFLTQSAACHNPEPNSVLDAPHAAQDAQGVMSAREFVWWYNAHPDAAQLKVDLSKVGARVFKSRAKLGSQAATTNHLTRKIQRHMLPLPALLFDLA